jgi:protein-L-isoaspartate(D-aspartate) O-methyltransferase
MPYEDSPQFIGYEATISAPHMHASVGSIRSSTVHIAELKQASEALLEYLHPKAQVLDVGSGSGYLTHVLANLVGSEGRVIGVDHIDGLVQLARNNMSKSDEGQSLLDSARVKFVKADGRLGFKEDGRSQMTSFTTYGS